MKAHPIFKDYASDIDGNVYSLKFGKVKEISKCPHGRGYLQFNISMNGEKKPYLIHRFVYECWTEKPIDGQWQCHHIDHNKHNNHFDNLQLVDQWENMQYGKEAGVLYGAANPKHPFYWQ